MFKFETNGFDELNKHLEKMQRDAKDLQKTTNVSFDELFTNTFMNKHTRYESIDAFIESGNFSQSNFEKIPDADLDKFVASETNFKDWQDMLDSAGADYALKKLGF